MDARVVSFSISKESIQYNKRQELVLLATSLVPQLRVEPSRTSTS